MISTTDLFGVLFSFVKLLCIENIIKQPRALNEGMSCELKLKAAFALSFRVFYSIRRTSPGGRKPAQNFR